MAKKVYSSNKSTQVVAILDYLDAKGQEMIEKANTERIKTMNDQSGNLHDAYIYAVYYYGRLMRKGYLEDGEMSTGTHHGWARHGYPADTGRGYADDALANYSQSTKAFSLVVLNGAYYGKILEDGAQGGERRKYKVLTQIADDMDGIVSDFLKKFKGASKVTFNPIKV